MNPCLKDNDSSRFAVLAERKGRGSRATAMGNYSGGASAKAVFRKNLLSYAEKSTCQKVGKVL